MRVRVRKWWDRLVRRLFPDPVDSLDREALIAAYAYPAIGVEDSWLRANMVATVDGAAKGPDGRSGSINTKSDRLVFSILRGLADAVVAGAGTVRAEGYGPAHPLPEFVERRSAAGQRPAPPIVVVSRSLDLDPASRLFTGPERTVVLTAAATDHGRLRALAKVADIVVAGDHAVEPHEALSALRARGWHRVLLEGGPTLLADWIAAGVVDELCLTISPLLAGGGHGRIVEGAPWEATRPVELVQLLEDAGTLFARYRLATQASG